GRRSNRLHARKRDKRKVRVVEDVVEDAVIEQTTLTVESDQLIETNQPTVIEIDNTAEGRITFRQMSTDDKRRIREKEAPEWYAELRRNGRKITPAKLAAKIKEKYPQLKGSLNLNHTVIKWIKKWEGRGATLR